MAMILADQIDHRLANGTAVLSSIRSIRRSTRQILVLRRGCAKCSVRLWMQGGPVTNIQSSEWDDRCIPWLKPHPHANHTESCRVLVRRAWSPSCLGSLGDDRFMIARAGVGTVADQAGWVAPRAIPIARQKRGRNGHAPDSRCVCFTVARDSSMHRGRTPWNRIVR
jgi:hypothetical protein